MIVAKQTKALLLLASWIGTIAMALLSSLIFAGKPSLVAYIAGLFALLGLACALIIILPTAREYPAGFCQSCGYNLNANVSGRCPECGTHVTPKPFIATPPADSPHHADAK